VRGELGRLRGAGGALRSMKSIPLIDPDRFERLTDESLPESSLRGNEEASTRQTFAVKGGVGDFLQCLPYMRAHPEHRYLVASHHDRVAEFFAAAGVRAEEEYLGKLGGVAACPRATFFDRWPFPWAPRRLFSDDRPIVGVHLEASSYSLNVERRFGFPPKTLPATVLTKLMSALPDRNFFLFGSLGEAIDLEINTRANFRVVRKPNVADSLLHVHQCSALVGSDSAFKTMSAMLRIPTIVWVGDYLDRDRDERFVDPYVEAGVMSVFRYRDLSKENEVDAGVKFCVEQISSGKYGRVERGSIINDVMSGLITINDARMRMGLCSIGADGDTKVSPPLSFDLREAILSINTDGVVKA